MNGGRFEVGARVRTCVITVKVPLGTLGTVLQDFTLVDDLYEVHFDGQTRVHLMRDSELVPEADIALAQLHEE
jgi:hypothetical protein